MATEQPLLKLSARATMDLRQFQYRAMQLDNNGGIIPAGAGLNSIGILQDDPDIGQFGTIEVLGITKAIYGGVVAAGINLTPDAASALVAAGVGDAVMAYALESGNAGEVHSVLLVTRTATGIAGIVDSFGVLAFPVTLSEMDNIELLTDYVPGFAGSIEKISFVTSTPTTDVADSNCEISMLIDAVAVNGGVLAVDVGAAATDPDARGKVVEGSAIVADNAFNANSLIKIVVADTANPFTDGTGLILVTFKH